MAFIIAQVFGVFTLILTIIEFFATKKKFFILCNFTINLLLGIQYLLLNSLTGAYLCLFASVRYLIYLLKHKNKFFTGFWIPTFFVACNIIISVLTFKNWYDILPSISAVSVCIYPWFDNVDILKIGTLCIGPIWIVYDIMVDAWASLVMEIVALVTTLIIFIVLKVKENKSNKTQELGDKVIENDCV